ncbi:MAG TPA: potassium channel family protein, partial [Ktedonobacterales bacterium]
AARRDIDWSRPVTTKSSSAAPLPHGSSTAPAPWQPGQTLWVADRYAVVLVLIILDYLAISLQGVSAWGRVIVTAFTGATLLLTLRAAHARRIWLVLAAFYLVASALLTALATAVSASVGFAPTVASIGRLLLIITPVVILRDLARHPVVSVDTVLGAICAYLSLGIGFAVVYSAIDALGPQPFFAEIRHATPNDFLFFSFSTLTTVGYGNLLPRGSLGQTLAMLEALFGQIYLVIIVARLVSLWGQQNPRASRRDRPAESAPDSASRPES